MLLPAYFAFGVGLSLVVAVLVIIAVVGPMTPLLAELCGGEARGRFWSRISSVLVVLSAMLLSMIPISPSMVMDASDPYVAFWVVVAQLKWALAGIIASFVLIAIVVGTTISSYEQKRGARAGPAEPSSQPL